MMVSVREELEMLAECVADCRFEEEALRAKFIDQCLAEYDEHYDTEEEFDYEDEEQVENVRWCLDELMGRVDHEAFASFVKLTVTVDNSDVMKIRQGQLNEVIQKQAMEYLTEQGIAVEEIRVALSHNELPDFKLSRGLTVTEDALQHEEQLRSIASKCIMDVAGEITQEEKDRRAEVDRMIEELSADFRAYMEKQRADADDSVCGGEGRG